MRFDNAPEIATAQLTPDGFFTLVGAWSQTVTVLPPWTLFVYRAVVDFKMEGDHVDTLALARVELRRHAAWVQHLEAPATRTDTHPSRYATLVIAANELPLHPSLVPFLWARSGTARVEFVRWLATMRGVSSVVAVIQSHPMSAQITRQLVETPSEDELFRQRGLEMARILLEGYPEVANEIRDNAEKKGIDTALQPLEHQFARRLGRALTPADHATLTHRLVTHGPNRLGDVVLDLDRESLDRWLCDPDAQ